MERSDSVNLEEAFFARKNVELLEDLRKKANKAERRDALRRVVGIRDDAFLDRLIAMNIGPERAMALRLIPLVFVAWADGTMDDEEREAILRAARQEGLVREDLATRVLKDWLESPPDPSVLTLWKDYVREIWPRFTPDEQWQMRKNLINASQDVASAAGGFLGLAKISAAEQALLDDLQKVVE